MDHVRGIWLVWLVGACGETSAAPATPARIPIAATETLLGEIVVKQPAAGPIRLDVPRMVGVDRKLDVMVSVAAPGPVTVELVLRGPTLTDTQSIRLSALTVKDRPCEKSPISRDLVSPLPASCPALHGWVVFPAKLPAGEYQITARAQGLPPATATVPVAWQGLYTTHRYHPDAELSGYRLAAVGFVKSTIGAAPIHPHRALFEHGTDRLVVDVIVNGAAGVIDRDTQKTFYRPGAPEVIAGKTVLLERRRDGFEIRWLTRAPRTWSTLLVRIAGARLGDRERRVVESYLAHLPPPPWPLRFNPMLGYTPPPAPGRCPADATHCCMEDGRVIAVEGCDPQGGYPVKREADGMCAMVPCFARCLPANARIATPNGDREISSLHAGDLVWTTDDRGQRISAPVTRVASIPVDAHTIVEIELADGRIARGSKGHPIADGVTLGILDVGDLLDGSPVVRVRSRPYRGATWDLLPATYWADGVPMRSTLE